MREQSWYTEPNPIPVDYDNTNIAPYPNSVPTYWESSAISRASSPTNLNGHPEILRTPYTDYQHHGDNDWFCHEIDRLCT